MPLDLSTAHQRLIHIEIEDAKYIIEDEDLATYSKKVSDQETEAEAIRSIEKEQLDLQERLSSDIPRSQKNRDRNRTMRANSRAAARLDELCLILDAFLLDVIDHRNVRTISEPLRLAVTNILQAGQTTAYAVALLLKHGYVVDADARWRGLYELTCQAAVMAQAGDSELTALRYLMHGQEDLAKNRLKPSDLAKGQAIVQQELLRGRPNINPQTNLQGPPFWEGDYQWIPVDLLGGSPRKKIGQKDLFAIADLRVAPSSFVDDSHKSVHMSSLTVASESTVALDHDPGGYSAKLEYEIAKRTALTLYELVANCCLLAPEPHSGHSFVAWAQEYHKRVRAAVEILS